MTITYKYYGKFSLIPRGKQQIILNTLGLRDGVMREMAKNQDASCYIACIGRVPVGWVSVVYFEGKQEIHSFVNNDFRKMGIGRKLVEKMAARYSKDFPGEKLGAYMNTPTRKGLYRDISILEDRTIDRYGYYYTSPGY